MSNANKLAMTVWSKLLNTSKSKLHQAMEKVVWEVHSSLFSHPLPVPIVVMMSVQNVVPVKTVALVVPLEEVVVGVAVHVVVPVELVPVVANNEGVTEVVQQLPQLLMS